MGVYVNGNMQSMLEEVEQYIRGREEGVRGLVGGDFNTRTGRKRGLIMEDREEEGG